LDGLPQRALFYTPNFEKITGKPVIASDVALYWRIFKTLGIAPTGEHGHLLSKLK